MSARAREEIAPIILIWWCMFTFITSGFEHSIANMCGLMLGLLLPHGTMITAGGYVYNLALTTMGNIVGGAVFVGMMYWIGSPKARELARARQIASMDATNAEVRTVLAGSRDKRW